MAQFFPTIRARMPFNVAEDANTLKKAMKGLGTDEAAIIRVLSCPSIQRQAIMEHYNKAFERDLIKDLKKELSGNFEEVILAMMEPLYDYLAKELRKAIKHKNDLVINEILSTHDNSMIRAIKASYDRQFDDNVNEDLKKALTGTFENVMLGMATAQRSDEFRPELSHGIAERLYNNGQGLPEGEMVTLFATLSFRQLQDVFTEYYKLAGRTLGETFDHEYKGHEKTNMKAVFQSLEKRSAFFAEALHRSMVGIGTKDQDLIRIMVSRSEIDLASIKVEYQTLYNKALEAEIKAECSGEYKKMLLTFVNPNYYL